MTINPILDNDRLTMLRTEVDDDGFLMELIDCYQTAADALIQNLDSALRNRDHKSIEFFAHKLRGAAENLGILVVVALSATIEDVGRTIGDLEGVASTLDAIKEANQKGCTALKSLSWFTAA